MTFSVDALGLGRGAEQFGDIFEAILLRPLGKGAILLVGLTLSSKSFLQIVNSVHRCSLVFLIGVQQQMQHCLPSISGIRSIARC